MKSLIHTLLKFTWTIREYKDKDQKLQWHFNMYNPVGWVLLFVCAVFVGLLEGIRTVLTVMYRMVKETVQDSLNR